MFMKETSIENEDRKIYTEKDRNSPLKKYILFIHTHKYNYDYRINNITLIPVYVTHLQSPSFGTTKFNNIKAI